MKLRTLVYSVHVALTSVGAIVTAAEQQAGNNAAPVAPVAPLDTAFLESAVKSIQSYRHDDSAMRELLGRGANVNAADAAGNNALMLVIKSVDGHSEYQITKELFDFLRDAGINLHARNKDGLNAAELNCCLYYPYEFLYQRFLPTKRHQGAAAH